MTPISFAYEGISSKFCLWLGTCKYNKHWGVIFEGTLKSVFPFDGSFCVAIYSGTTTPNY